MMGPGFFGAALWPFFVRLLGYIALGAFVLILVSCGVGYYLGRTM